MTGTGPQRDFYQVLGVARDAGAAEIRGAYARLARRHHPDVAGHLPDRLRDVQAAYRCLADPGARAEHDRAIATAERLHQERQRRVQHRLRGYDRRHPRLPPRPPARRRLIVLLAVAVAMAAGLSLQLPW